MRSNSRETGLHETTETLASSSPIELLALPAADARAELLRSEHFCNFELPDYFEFSRLLRELDRCISGRPESEMGYQNAQHCDKANYVVVHNKDGRLAWRQLTLIHPVLYLALVNDITAEYNWGILQKRFSELRNIPRFQCSSRPVASVPPVSNQGQQIREWWAKSEQASIESALHFSHIVRTDVSDCYGSIYTHAIPWAIHGKLKAKKHRRSPKLLGNRIDKLVRSLNAGQTNGISQGSTVMDFIAELVLAYADEQLAQKLSEACICDFRIIRHRDDYRIFVNEPRTGETVLKMLAEVLMDLGMGLNTTKTSASDDVIGSAIKADKFEWLSKNPYESDLQKQLLAIREHSLKYPDGGSVIRALLEVIHKPLRITHRQTLLPTISILADIACHNPRTYPLTAGLLSRMLNEFEDPTKKAEVMTAVADRFDRLPNAELMHVWVQRVGLPIEFKRAWNSELCKVVENRGTTKSQTTGIWNSDWIEDEDIKRAVCSGGILEPGDFEEIPRVIPDHELNAFFSDYVG